MKRRLTLPVLALALSACHSKPPQGNEQTDTSQNPAASTQSAPLIVAASSVQAQDPTVLAQANWTGKACALTVEDDKQTEVQPVIGQPLHLAGYFIDPEDKPAGDFQVALMGIDKNYVFPAKTGWDRTDVADYFGKPALATSGFDVNVDLANVPPATYKLNFVVDRGPKGKFFCESGKKLIVPGNSALSSPTSAAVTTAPTAGAASPASGDTPAPPSENATK